MGLLKKESKNTQQGKFKKADYFVNAALPNTAKTSSISFNPIMLYKDNINHAKIIEALSNDPDGSRLKNFLSQLTGTFRSAEPVEQEFNL